MANILSIKRRIIAAQNVSKTTKAMQMISASKLKKAQKAALSSKPYVDEITSLSQGINQKLKTKNKKKVLHPYFIRNESAKDCLVIALSPDKGFCGGLLTNLTKELIKTDTEINDIVYITVGKKIEKLTARLGKKILASFNFGYALPTFDAVSPIISLVESNFLEKKVNSVKILSMRFKNAFSQTPSLSNILPIELPDIDENITRPEFTLFEPKPTKLLPILLKKYLDMSIYQLFLEEYASEQAARMITMQNATDNAADVIQSFQLEYNKERQEKITNEILDISGGAYTYAI